MVMATKTTTTIFKLSALFEVTAVTFDRFGSLLEDAHVDLDDADAKDGSLGELRLHLSDADEAVGGREKHGGRGHGEHELRRLSSPEKPSNGLVDREVDQCDQRRDEEGPSDVGHLRRHRQHVKAVREIGGKQRRVGPLHHEEDGNGHRCRRPTAAAQQPIDHRVERVVEAEVHAER